MIYHNKQCLINLDTNPPKRTVIGRFEPQPDKKDRNWSIWTLTCENGPRLIDFDPELSKRTVIRRFGSQPDKTGRNWLI